MACASSGFDGRIYHNGDLRFRVGQIPSTWRTIDVDDALLAFRDDPANATVALNGRCHVDGDDVPLASLTQHLFLQFTDRDLGTQKPLSLDGREALRTEMEVIWLVRGDAEPGRDYDPDGLTWLWDVTSRADKRIIERNQAGVASRAYEPGPFSLMEPGTQAYVERYVAELGGRAGGL